MGADLQDADLSGADLKGADLRGIDLEGADLSGADMRKAIVFTTEQLKSAIIDERTKLPEDFEPFKEEILKKQRERDKAVREVK
jgi:hypothetical protein